MIFKFEPMNQQYVDIIVGWHYEAPYTFYDMDQDAEDLAEFIDPSNWPNVHYAVQDEKGELVGEFAFQVDGDVLEIGLGLRPDLTGNGLGLDFVKAGMAFGERKFRPKQFRLLVATFNERAIKVYMKAGFKKDEVFLRKTNGGEYEFLRMTKDV